MRREKLSRHSKRQEKGNQSRVLKEKMPAYQESAADDNNKQVAKDSRSYSRHSKRHRQTGERQSKQSADRNNASKSIKCSSGEEERSRENQPDK